MHKGRPDSVLTGQQQKAIIQSYLQKTQFFINQHNLILNTVSLPLVTSQALSESKFSFSELSKQPPNQNLCPSYSLSPRCLSKAQISTNYLPSQNPSMAHLCNKENPKSLMCLSHSKLFAVLKTFLHPLVSLQVVPSAHNVPV